MSNKFDINPIYTTDGSRFYAPKADSIRQSAVTQARHAPRQETFLAGFLLRCSCHTAGWDTYVSSDTDK